MFSRILSLLMLLMLSPLFLLVAILIFGEDGTPVFFKQKRVGVDNSFFHIYKFRSMKNKTPNVATHLLDNPSQYFLKIGRILRKFSFDELPNLINVLRGEMVFVGPRPALYNQADLMAMRVKAGIDHLKPGITGWAQINGRDEITLEEKVAFEKEYLERKSLRFDIKIIGLTVSRVFKCDGVNN